MADAVSVMSGAEADVSSDGDSSFEDLQLPPLPPSPLKEGTDEPFLVVLKGGRPWGFTLKTGSESKSSILIDELEETGKAWDSGQLRAGDYILEVNEVRCHCQDEAQQLIDSAFRTLTLKVWRGTSDSLSSTPVRSASFLQKSRELTERARQQASVQDDSVLFRESKNANSARMKPRQRRIESFHGGRRGSSQSSSSSGAPLSVSTPRQPPSQHADIGAAPQNTPGTNPATATPNASTPNSSEDSTGSKPGLKGWATEHDLSSSRQPVIMSGSHMTRNVPLTPAKSSPSLNQEDFVNSGTAMPQAYSSKQSPSSTNMTKSTTDIPENVTNYDNVTSPTSPKSSWYQQKLPSRTVFEFNTSSSRRSPRNSFAGGTPRSSYVSGSPRNSFTGSSPRNSYVGYSSQPVQSPVQGFAPMSVSNPGLSRQSDPSSRVGANSSNSNSQSQKLTGANTNSYDDTPTHSVHQSNKNYDRRSLPPHALQQFRQEYQRDNVKSTEVQKPLTSMPVTREEDDLDKEIPDMKPYPPNDLDLRPMYSPPAPPVRDISSLKYVKHAQNHEKYPSWPVTTAQPPQNLGPPIDAQQSDKGKEYESGSGENSDKIIQDVREKTRHPVERRGSEEKQSRNQSDPFRQKPKKSFYTTRKPRMPDHSNDKPEGERFDEFCKTSKPGYPPPKLDPDGHNYGDEKYSIPSPPERDVPGFDEKSLVEKIAAVISPNSQYQPAYHHSPSYQYNLANDTSTPRSTHTAETGTSPMQHSTSPKMPGIYFQQAINAQSLLKANNMQNKNMVDSCTSPIHSDDNKSNKGLRTMTGNPRSESFASPNERRGLIIKQLPYYNTSTQTDESLDNQPKSDQTDMGNQCGQGPMSLSSVSSSASNVRSDTSSQSSGVSTMHFSDHSSAGMLRKLSEEFYRGKLSGMNPSEKRMSSASTYDELKSPRSDGQYSGLREAESYSSVVIHAHESSGLFGRDDLGSSPSLASSKPEMSDTEHEQYNDFRYKSSRLSMDAGMALKSPPNANKVTQSRGLQDSRFTSESNLSSGNYPQRSSHSQSLMHLNRPASSLGDGNQTRDSRQSSQSSSGSSSRPRGSMEARSSGSRVGSSDSSTTPGKNNDTNRPVSDSVFYENKVNSPMLPPDTDKVDKVVTSHSVGIGRKESMKMAFGTYDENEHHYATPYGHQRNNSEVLSPTARDPAVIHSRSASCNNDYMPMHYSSQSDTNKLGLIKEEGSESRWQEAVQKSRSLSRESSSNYENFSPSNLESNSPFRGSDSDKSDAEKPQDSRKGMRRTASEQIRPTRAEKQLAQPKYSDSSNKGGYSSSGGESSKGNKSDSENGNYPQLSDLRKMQQKAVLDYVERKKKGSDSSEPQSPKVKDTAPEFPPPPIPEPKSPVNVNPTTQSPLGDITKRYKLTQQQRGESLRRTQSITSNSSRESDYMDMKRHEERNYQTEWKRLRAMDGGPRRPLSIGSDVSSLEGLQPLMAGQDEVIHRRSNSETLPKHIEAEQSRAEQNISPGDDDGSMLTAPIYHNLSTGEYPRRPPPPVPGPGGNPDDKPPALPPRRGFASSKSESFLLARMDSRDREGLKDSFSTRDVSAGGGAPTGPSGGPTRAWDGTGTLKEDAYAQQLRKQARRFSEQHNKPPGVGISMQVVSTKNTVQVSLSQSYKQEPTQALEAMPVQRHSPQSSQVHLDVKPVTAGMHAHSPPSSRDRLTPEPPPMPTPLKNGETEIHTDLNKTADFPPPPTDFMEGGDEQKDRCADDSYGSYKTRETREVGKYKRTTSDSSLLRSHQEPKSYRPVLDLNSKEVAENTPNKPPRKKLELGVDSPGQGRRSKSPNAVHSGGDNHTTSQRAAPQVPAFQAAEVSSVQQAPKYMAKPLQGLSVQKLNSPTGMPGSSGGSFVGTVVQRPAMSQSELIAQAAAEEAARTSVKDRVKNIEVFSHSPGAQRSSNGSNKAFSDDISVQPQASDSLEQLEISTTSSDNFRDRLRPVVKKGDTDRSEEVVANHSSAAPVGVSSHRVSSTDIPDNMASTPPIVPNRTYKQHHQPQQQQHSSNPPYRRESFQTNRGPKPYENKSNSAGANPVHNNFVNPYKAGSGVSGSGPEPQVPSRSQKSSRSPQGSHSEQFTRDQNINMSSQENRNSSNYSDTQVHSSVHSGQKRNYEKSFSRTRSSSGGSSNSSDVNAPTGGNYHNWHPANTHGDTNMVANSSHRADSTAHRPDSSSHRPDSSSHRPDNHAHRSDSSSHRGDNRANEQRHQQLHEQRSPGSQSRYNQSHSSRGQPPQQVHSSNPNAPSVQDSNRSPVNRSPVNRSPVPGVRERNRSSEMKQDPNSYLSNQSPNFNSRNSHELKPEANLSQGQEARKLSGDKSSAPGAVTVNHGRTPSAEELECDQKAQELAKVLKDSDKELCDVLSTECKKNRMQFLDGILPVEGENDVERRPRSGTKTEKDENKKEEEEKQSEPTSPMPPNYYVSPPKAMIELEIRKLTDNNQLTHDLGDNDTLAQKKEELLASMIKKVDILKDDKKELAVDIDDNETLGKQVTGYIEEKCRNQQEKDKYKGYIDDIDKIIRLLLKLSGLLARAENTIQGLTENTNEKMRKLTLDKRDRLYRQHEEAKALKMDIDKRSDQLEEILHDCLTSTELNDYHYYIKMKSKYTIQMQELEDKITLGNEQISALQKSMPTN